MKKTQLIAVLKTFGKKEHKFFVKWLASPVFNQRTDVQRLYKYLLQGNHLTENKFLEKERVFKKIFPSIPFNDAKLRQTVHFLLKQVEDFLVYQQQKEDLLGQHLLLTKVYRKRKVPTAFQRQIKIAQKAFSQTKEKNNRTLRLQYELGDEYITYIKEQPEKVSINFQESIDALDMYVVAEKLKQACHVIAHKKVFKSEFEIRFLPSILNSVKNDPQLIKQPSIAVYFHGYLMQIEKDEPLAEKHYFYLRKLIEEKFNSFPDNERRDIYLMALNFCIRKMHGGFQKFLREAFEMYKKGLDDYILIQEGILSSITYLNISTLAIRLKEFEWTKKFVANYSGFLETQDRENFKQYTLAKLLFEQKKYSEALELLVQFESKHILVNLNAKQMLIKMYYEQDKVDILESLLDSLSIYLRRKEIIGYHKANYQNIVKYTRKLLRLNPFDKEKRAILLKEIEETSPLTEQTWLLEQIDKL